MAIDLRIGTSGYSFDAWKGHFYPAGCAAGAMLPLYAAAFACTEVANTFYRMPGSATLGRWATQVPERFRFALKAPQQVTHGRRLREPAAPMQAFFAEAAPLGARRGPTLVQMPPYLKKDLPRLEAFLAAVPAGEPLAFDFRHPSWFDDQVGAALAARGAALCMVDLEPPEASTPRLPLGSFGYLRLQRATYTEAQMRALYGWLLAQGWPHAYVFFKQADSAVSPALAQQMIQVVRDY